MDCIEGGKAPFILGIAGKSDTGKTTLILRLVPEFVKRGCRVGVVKNCPHGFQMDKEGKDSWKFSQAGGEGILLTSAKRFALIRRKNTENSEHIRRLISLLFYGFDIVLVEGYRNLQGVKKIELLRKGICEHTDPLLREVIAFVSDIHKVDTKEDKPVFKPDEINKIADFVERTMENEAVKSDVEIMVNGEKLPLNFFVKQMVRNLALGVVQPLKKKNKQEDIKEVVIKVYLRN